MHKPPFMNIYDKEKQFASLCSKSRARCQVEFSKIHTFVLKDSYAFLRANHAKGEINVATELWSEHFSLNLNSKEMTTQCLFILLEYIFI